MKSIMFLIASTLFAACATTMSSRETMQADVEEAAAIVRAIDDPGLRTMLGKIFFLHQSDDTVVEGIHTDGLIERILVREEALREADGQHRVDERVRRERRALDEVADLHHALRPEPVHEPADVRDQRGDRQEDLAEPVRVRLVRLEVRREEHRVRAQAAGPHRRHRVADGARGGGDRFPHPDVRDLPVLLADQELLARRAWDSQTTVSLPPGHPIRHGSDNLATHFFHAAEVIAYTS